MLLKAGALDWRTGEACNVTTYFDDAVDIHHIFPKAWCDAQKIKSHIYNSIINKTPLTARTNRVIGGRAPSHYLSRLASGAKVDADTIGKQVATHLVDPALLSIDDFEAFFAARRRALLDEIAAAIGKTIDDSQPTLLDVAQTLDAEDDTDDL